MLPRWPWLAWRSRLQRRRRAAAQRPAPREAADGATRARAVTYGRRDDVLRFAAELAERQGLDPAWVQAAAGAARFQPSVQRLIMPPPAGTAKNWAAYRARFVEPKRIARRRCASGTPTSAWLQRAEERYGVPAEIVVGIVGVETLYGRRWATSA